MRLKIDDICSPNLHPPSEGLPADPRDFAVFMEVVLRRSFHRGYILFRFFACSPGRDDSDRQPALVLETFDWGEIRRRIGDLVAQCHVCKTWDDVIAKLKGKLEFYDG